MLYISSLTPNALTHPDYLASLNDWTKWRYTYKGGSSFIEKYLQKFTNREDHQDYLDRKSITYCPAFAKAGIEEVKNSIYQRMSDITRVEGSESYTQAVNGKGGGVDLKGNTMNSYIGQEILTELLVMSKVGVYVDMPAMQTGSIIEAQQAKPYLYTYKREDIRNWTYYRDELTSVLLRDYEYVYDEATGFPMSFKTMYRHLRKEDGVVKIKFYDEIGDACCEEIILNIPKIPFSIFEISNSLLEDVADYQIALLNVASSDIAYTLKANFPFYTEQYDPRNFNNFVRYQGPSQFDDDGNEIDQGQANQDVSGDNEIKVGATAGRRYPIGADQPAFIHPSAEPMLASMQKQEQLKREIRLLLHLSLSSVKTVGSESAESKKEDNRTLEAGLANIGMTLEKGERLIAEFWANYEGKTTPTVHYPINYSLRSEEDRRAEAKDLNELMKTLPSETYQKEIGKQMARILLSHYIPADTLAKVEAEIDKAPNMVADPDIVAKDVENGLCSPETGSLLRGYPEGEAVKAEEAHAKRLQRIALSQTKAEARGIRDLGANPNSGKEEKAESRDTDQDDMVRDKTRGENDSDS
jgi:hypothetical protein